MRISVIINGTAPCPRILVYIVTAMCATMNVKTISKDAIARIAILQTFLKALIHNTMEMAVKKEMVIVFGKRKEQGAVLIVQIVAVLKTILIVTV